MVTPKTFLKKLVRAKDINQHFSCIVELCKNEDIETLKKLFLDVCKKFTMEPNDWAPIAVCERIVEVLALKEGFKFAKAAIELADSILRTKNVQNQRFSTAYVVSMIVCGQSKNTIHKLIDQERDLDRRGMLLQEAVVRNKISNDSRSVVETLDSLGIDNHPLAFLPASLLDFEVDLQVRTYSIGASGMATSYGPSAEHGKAWKPGSNDQGFDFDVVETTTDERADRISAAAVNWTQESNGMIEARTFHLSNFESDEPATKLPMIVSKLGLKCLEPEGSGEITINATLPSIFRLLFSAAATGGAYNMGEHSAYGRLAAWRSLGGLVGAAAGEPIEVIVELAQACHWIKFCASNDWFYQVAWDLGIICYHPPTKQLAVLAATDTD